MSDPKEVPKTPKPARAWISFGMAAIIIVFAGVIFYTGAVNKISGVVINPPNPDTPSPTETQFVNDVGQGADADVLSEWREARGDHKMIAYIIAGCRGVRDLDTMTRSLFSTLLLDLTPLGEHKVPSAITNVRGSPSTAALTSFGPYEKTVLLVSDSISRERIAVAADAGKYRPDVSRWGWATIIVSALATLLITIKSSMSPPDKTSTASETESKGLYADVSKFWTRLFFTPRGWYGIIGFAAMVVSAAGTTLTTAKTFYDPTRNYVADETALLALRKLHREIAYSVMESAIGSVNTRDQLLSPGQPDAVPQKIGADTQLARPVPAVPVMPTPIGESAQTSGAENKDAAPVWRCAGWSQDLQKLQKWSETFHTIQSTRILASLPTTESGRRNQQ